MQEIDGWTMAGLAAILLLILWVHAGVPFQSYSSRRTDDE